MKIVLLVFVCLLAGPAIFGQSAPLESGAEEITFFRDDGAGEAGAETENFLTADRPLHFSVRLGSASPALVKMNIVTVDVPGQKAGRSVVRISYKTSDGDDVVNFTTSPRIVWAPGTYRVDVFIDGRPAVRRAFVVKKAVKTR